MKIAQSLRLLKQRQHGSVLVITLIFMVLLTMLGLGAVALNTTEIRLAASAADTQVAFQTAEGAISQAQQSITSGSISASDFTNANGLYIFNPANTPIWTTVDWTNASSVISGFQGNSKSTAAYIIERLPSFTRPGQSFSKPTQVYRITARSVGLSGGAPVMLQSVVQIQP